MLAREVGNILVFVYDVKIDSRNYGGTAKSEGKVDGKPVSL